MNKEEIELKELNAVIQVCPKCGKIDVYKGDNHFCNAKAELDRQENEEHYD